MHGAGRVKIVKTESALGETKTIFCKILRVFLSKLKKNSGHKL